MKKTKTVLATLSVATALTTFAPLATPVLADGSAATQVTQTQLKDGTQTIGVTYKKTGEETPSEAGRWLGNGNGNTIRVTVTNHQVSQLVIPNVNAATAGMIKTVTVNGQTGQVQKNTDGSVDYVFGAAAYKEGQGTIAFNLAVPGVNSVEADMYLATNELPTEPVTPAKPAQPATGAASSSVTSQATSASSSSASQATSSSASSSSQTSNAKPAAQPTNNNNVSGTQTGADKTSQEETATIAFYKTGTTEKSVAANFFAPNVNAEVDANGKVTKLVLGISQNASMVKAISLNGVKGTVAVDKDGSGTATFAGAAYKEGKGVINFTIDFGQGPYSPSADVVLGALKAGQAKFTKSNNPAPALSELSGSTQAPTPTLPTSSNNGASQVPVANQTKQAVLPQTGDNSAKTADLTLAGLGSVVAAGLAFVLGKKRQAD